MATFILTFTISFILLLTGGLFIGYSKRRERKTAPGRPTGRCHETGGEMCGCCSSSIQGLRPPSRRSCGDRTELPADRPARH